MLTAGKLFVKTFRIFDTRKDDNLTNVQLIAMIQICEDKGLSFLLGYQHFKTLTGSSSNHLRKLVFTALYNLTFFHD